MVCIRFSVLAEFSGGFAVSKGLAKIGNIVADANVSSLAARETCVADTNFASETYVSQFSHPGKHNKKHCFRNNVS